MAIIERPNVTRQAAWAFESLDSFGPPVRVYMPGL